MSSLDVEALIGDMRRIRGLRLNLVVEEINGALRIERKLPDRMKERKDLPSCACENPLMCSSVLKYVFLALRANK